MHIFIAPAAVYLEYMFLRVFFQSMFLSFLCFYVDLLPSTDVINK